MQGAANLTVANAQYQLTTQQARIVREQANRENLATRKATLQEQQYESQQWQQQYDPNAMRQRDIEHALRSSMNDPPKAEIWSGDALNALLQNIQKAQASGVAVPPVPVPPDLLAHINVTTGTTYQGVGMLKNLTRFNWPQALRGGAYKMQREEIEQMCRTAVDQVKSGNVDADLLDKLNEAVKNLGEQVDAAAAQITPTQLVQSMRYVRELKQSFKVLQDPNVADYFSKYKAQGGTVDQLVQNMSGQGLKFAPAAPGDEPSYTALHTDMVAYVTRLQQVGGH
jgi:hypothetical protein